jgi:protein-S-isoprenylcysteine O-methyltransferase Ste14
MAIARPAALAFAWTGALLFGASLIVFLYAFLVSFGRAAPPGPASWDLVVNVLLFSVFALHHSLLARTRAKALISRLVAPDLERSLYVWTASLLFILVCLRWRSLPGELYDLDGAVAAVCYGIQVAAILMTIRVSSLLGTADLAGLRPLIRPEPAGHDDATHVPLRTTGPYGLVRHPLYLAWFLFVFSAPHMTMTRFAFAIISSAYLAIAIPFEERGLVEMFGDRYREYRQKVTWRMLPGLY